MIQAQLKLKLSRRQERQLDRWLFHLTSVWNWTIKKIEYDARDRIYHSAFDLQLLINRHGARIDVPQDALYGTVANAHTAWQRCFKRLTRKPRLKGRRNKLNSVAFAHGTRFLGNRLVVPIAGRLRFHKQEIPAGRISQLRLVKRSSLPPARRRRTKRRTRMNQLNQLLAEIDKAEVLDAGQNAARQRFSEAAMREADATKARILLAELGAGNFTVYELLYAAGARCVCGAGMAYPEGIGMHGAWYCSNILLGKAQAGSEHSSAYPFMFYEVKSEDPERGTTRPTGTHIEKEIHWACANCGTTGTSPRFRANQRDVQKALSCTKCGERYINSDGSNNSKMKTRYFHVVANDE